MDIMRDIDEVNEVNEVVRNRQGDNVRLYNERADPFISYSNRLFRKKYRFTKIQFEDLMLIIGNRMNDRNNHHRGLPIPPQLQVLACLRLFAKGTYQDCSADKHGFSQPTMSRIVQRVSVVLAELKNDYIQFPSRNEENQEMVNFFRIARFPRVIGCIDGTHIPIGNPGGPYAAVYLNRKNFYSLNVQVISNSQCKITNIVARWRGSAHDSRIFNESAIKRRFEEGEFRGILLGDNGYPCLPYLLTPILNPQTVAEEAYNISHRSTRNVVERLFGIWKMTFRSLNRGLTPKLPTAKIMIVAMAVLHNILRDMRNDDRDGDETESTDSEEEDEDLGDQPNQPIPPRHLRGNIVRQNFIAQHFQ